MLNFLNPILRANLSSWCRTYEKRLRRLPYMVVRTIVAYTAEIDSCTGRYTEFGIQWIPPPTVGQTHHIKHHTTTAKHHHTTTAQHRHTTTAPQSHTTTAPRHHSNTAPHKQSTTVIHYHNTTVPSHHTTIFPQHHSPTPPHHQSPYLHITTVLHHHIIPPRYPSPTSPHHHKTAVPHHHSITPPQNRKATSPATLRLPTSTVDFHVLKLNFPCDDVVCETNLWWGIPHVHHTS